MNSTEHPGLQAEEMTNDFIHFTSSIDDHQRFRTVRRYLPEVAAVNAVHQQVDNTIDRNTIQWPVVVRLFEHPDTDPKWIYAVHQALRPVLVQINGTNVPLGD